MQHLDLGPIEARANAATSGPWGVYEYGGSSLIEIAADLKETGTGYSARRTVCRFDEEPLDNDPTHREWTAEEDWAQVQADAVFAAHARTDIPAMAAEVRRLRAVAEAFRVTFGDILVRGKDGAWANVADYIATGARIPACGSFYPPATDTRCTRAKGHQGSHNAPWGLRDMSWPYDPRETQQPFTPAELATAQADVDHLNAEFPDEPADGNGRSGDEHAEPGIRGWTA